MRRRAFLTTAAVGVLGSAAGCLGGGPGPRNLGSAPDPSVSEAGLAPDPEEVPAPDADPDSFETLSVEGTEVALVPLEVARAWYHRREARFVDARSQRAYEAVHIHGAVLSTAPDGVADDPTEAWPSEERIVTYCACPHHLSTARGATLREEGHEAVFAIDEGFEPWVRNGYPIEGEDAEEFVRAEWTVSGRVGAEHAGQRVELRHEPSGQREPGPIADDGSFEVTAKFVGVEDATPVTLETPAFERTGPIGDLAAAPVTPE